METVYFIRKNASYMDELFIDPIGFGQTEPSLWRCYWYQNEQIARDIARRFGADVVSFEVDRQQGYINLESGVVLQ